MLLPIAASAQAIIKTPLSYSLQEYGIVLATALLGGAANWWIKVRKGELLAWNVAALIGELCVSAFSVGENIALTGIFHPIQATSAQKIVNEINTMLLLCM